jgi:hypothetical protein
LAAEATIGQLRLLIEKLRRELYGRRSERKAGLIELLELEELQASHRGRVPGRGRGACDGPPAGPRRSRTCNLEAWAVGWFGKSGRARAAGAAELSTTPATPVTTPGVLRSDDLIITSSIMWVGDASPNDAKKSQSR